jgi:hypothetical protein
MDIRRLEGFRGYPQASQGLETATPSPTGTPGDQVLLGARPDQDGCGSKPYGPPTTQAPPPSSAATPPTKAQGGGVLARAEELAHQVLRRDTHLTHQPGESRKLSVLAAGSTHFEALWTRDVGDVWGFWPRGGIRARSETLFRPS